MPTIKDVAKLAGVSTMTVSNVVHGRNDKVSKGTAEKIQNIIETIGYTPNIYARSLISNSSKIITFIKVENISNDSFFDDPFTSLFIDSLERELSKIGYYLMFKTVSSAEDLRTFLVTWNIDGIVAVGLNDENILSVLSNSQIAVVLIDSYINTDTVKSIRIDDFNGGFLATEYLINRGHKKIVTVAPSLADKGLNKYRISGFKSALGNHKINSDFVFDLSETDAATVAKEIISLKITAVFCLSDLTAIKLMNELKKFGLSIPEDISIIGFDDISLCSYVTPAMTTVHQDISKKGELAVKHITSILNKENNINMSEIIMPVSIKERYSVKSI